MARESVVIRQPIVVHNLVGQIAHVADATITIAECHDTLRIHVGMRLRAGVSAHDLRSGTLEVVSTDEDNGVVVVADPNAVACLAQGDRLYWSHEYQR